MIKTKKLFSLILIIVTLIVPLILLLIASSLFYNHPRYRIDDTLPDGNNKSAKVIILAGQSNAAGCSRDEYLKNNVSSEKYQEYKKGYNNIYINYYVSGNAESRKFVNVKNNQGEPGGFFGPELGMAEKLNELYPDQIFFIIKYTCSGTNLNEQWLSPSSKGKTGELYKGLISYVKESLTYLKLKNYNIQLEGMCWMQGESDSFSPVHATDYKDNLYNFIEDIRKELSKYTKELAFIDAYIADNPVYWVYCDMVNNSKKEVATMSTLNSLIDTIYHGLTCSNEPVNQPDMAHYDSMSELKLGYLFVEELIKFF